MSYLNNPDGTPRLEHHDELTKQWFHNSPHAREIILGITAQEDRQRPFRRQADRNATLDDTYQMIDELVTQFQMFFVPSNKNPWLLCFPFMLISPAPGDKIKNVTTNETYTVKYVPTNSRKQFTGSVLLNEGTDPPLTHQRLVYSNPEAIGHAERKLINFYHSYPPKQGGNYEESEGDTGYVKREPFVPTIVVELRRQEPGTIGKRPFDIAKEIKPRIRQIFQHPDDPRNYSVEIRGQWLDNILRFTCYDTSHRGALKLTAWFRNFMAKHTWILKKNGVQEILYWQRRADEQISKWRDDIVGYPVEYYFRTEELYVDMIHNIRTIDMTIGVDSGVDTGVGSSGGILVGPIGETYATWYDAMHDDSGNFLHGEFEIQDSFGL